MADSTSETLRHCRAVADKLTKAAFKLFWAGQAHDKDKLFKPFKVIWDTYSPRRVLRYGTPEYVEHLRELDPALRDHYDKSGHHPEHFINGVNGMDFLLLLEMLADWYDVCMTHGDSNFRRSIDVSCERFGIGDQLKEVLINTAVAMEML